MQAHTHTHTHITPRPCMQAHTHQIQRAHMDIHRPGSPCKHTHSRTHTQRNTHPCLGEQSNCGWSGGSHPCPPTHTLTLEPEHNPQLLCKCMCKRTNTYTFTFTHTHTHSPSPVNWCGCLILVFLHAHSPSFEHRHSTHKCTPRKRSKMPWPFHCCAACSSSVHTPTI